MAPKSDQNGSPNVSFGSILANGKDDDDNSDSDDNNDNDNNKKKKKLPKAKNNANYKEDH